MLDFLDCYASEVRSRPCRCDDDDDDAVFASRGMDFMDVIIITNSMGQWASGLLCCESLGLLVILVISHDLFAVTLLPCGCFDHRKKSLVHVLIVTCLHGLHIVVIGIWLLKLSPCVCACAASGSELMSEQASDDSHDSGVDGAESGDSDVDFFDDCEFDDLEFDWETNAALFGDSSDDREDVDVPRASGTPVGRLLSRIPRAGHFPPVLDPGLSGNPAPTITSTASSSSGVAGGAERTDPAAAETEPATTERITMTAPRRNRKKSGGPSPRPSQAPHIRAAAAAAAAAAGPLTSGGPMDEDGVPLGPSFDMSLCRIRPGSRDDGDDGQGDVLQSEASSSSAPPPKAAGPKPGSRACAKMLVRSGLRCGCCYLVKTECRFAQSKQNL